MAGFLHMPQGKWHTENGAEPRTAWGRRENEKAD